jgi:hypothetical protein
MANTPNQIVPTIGTGAVGSAPTGNSDRFVPTLWAKELAENRLSNLVLWPLIDSHYSGEISAYGDILKIPFLAEIDTSDVDTNYVPGTDVDVDSLDATTVDLIIDRYLRKAVGIQDAFKAQGKYEMRQPTERRLSRYLDVAKDVEVYTKMVDGFTNTPVQGSGTSGVLAFADIVDAAAVLDTANVPQTERYIVVNGKGLADLRKVAEFTLYDHVGQSSLVTGMLGIVGHIYGMPVYVTEAITANSDSTPAYDFVMFHKSALVCATQQVPAMEFYRDALKGQDDIIAGELFGVKVLRPDHGVVIKRTA